MSEENKQQEEKQEVWEDTTIDMPERIVNMFLSLIQQIITSDECTTDIHEDCLALTIDISNIKGTSLILTSKGSGRALGNITDLLTLLIKNGKEDK